MGDLPSFSKNQLICIRAPKGSGKTESIAQALAQHQYNRGKTLSLTHRQTLNNEQAKRFSLTNVNDSETDEFKGVFGKVLCFDSLLKVARGEQELESLQGAWLLLDEADQSLWHLLDAKTEVGKKRVPILQRLGEIIRYIIATKGKIILSSADLDDVTVNFYQALIGRKVKTLTIIADDQRTKNTKLYNYTENNPGHLVADLEKHILAGGKPFICLSGQKDKSTWGTKTLESHLLRLKYRRSDGTSLRILRIDQESLADPNHPAYGCMDSLNKLLPNYDVVIASPSIETGVSIDICGHFDSVWAIAYGVQTENSVRQALRRVREDIPRFFWASKTGMNRVGNGATSAKALYASTQNQTRQHLGLLAQAGGFFENEELQEVSGAALKAWCNIAARINLEMSTYRKSILAGLEEEGYIICDAGKDDNLALFKKKEIKQVRDANYEVHCEEVTEEIDISEDELQALQDKKTKTPQQQKQIKKAILKAKYGGIEVTPSLVKRDESGLHSQWQFDYYLQVGRAHLAHTDIRKAQKRIYGGYYFCPDLNQGLLGVKIAMLDCLGFTKLRHSQKPEHRNSDLDLIQFKQNCVLGAKAIKEWLGITINPNSSPVTIFKQFLNKLGLIIPLLRKEGSRGHQQRVYGGIMADCLRDEDGNVLLDELGRAVPVPDEREQVFHIWRERDEQKLEAELLLVEQKHRESDNLLEAVEILNHCHRFEDFFDIFHTLTKSIPGCRELLQKATTLLEKSKQVLIYQWLKIIESPA